MTSIFTLRIFVRLRLVSLGYGLVDSRAGLTGWILEKFYQWADCQGHPEDVLTRDELIDNLMMYWMPGCGASSARLYWEGFGKVDMREVTIPIGVRMSPKKDSNHLSAGFAAVMQTSCIIVSLKLADILLCSSSLVCLLMKCGRVLPP